MLSSAYIVTWYTRKLIGIPGLEFSKNASGMSELFLYGFQPFGARFLIRCTHWLLERIRESENLTCLWQK